MDKKLNLAEILKNCPKGTKLYSPLVGDVVLAEVDCEYDCIEVRTEVFDDVIHLFSDGKLYNVKGGECMLFPSEDNRDWSTFKVEKPKWNPKTLQPFDKVLVRDYNEDPWKGDFFVSLDWPNGKSYPYMAMTGYYKMIVPYNEDTKHLIATMNEAPEFYNI